MKEKLSNFQKYDALELMLDVMAADSVLDDKENELMEKTVKSLELDYSKFKEMRDIRLSKISTSNIGVSTSESLFGLDDEMSRKEKCSILTQEYTKWSGQTNNQDIERRTRDKEMVDIIIQLRQKYKC